MGISDGVARKVLSAPAYRIGEKAGGYVWFEEDEAASIPFFEHPEWYPLLFGKTYSDSMIASNERTVRQAYPRYFKMKEEGYTLPPKLAVNDRLTVTEPVKLSRGGFQAGQGLIVTKLTADYIYVTPEPPVPGITSARLPNGWYTGATGFGTLEDKIYLKKTASPARVVERFAAYPRTEVRIYGDNLNAYVGLAQDIVGGLIAAGMPKVKRDAFMAEVLNPDQQSWQKKSLPNEFIRDLLKRGAIKKAPKGVVDPSALQRPLSQSAAKSKLFKAIQAWAKDARSDWDPGDSGEGIESVAHDLAMSVLYDGEVADLIGPSGLSKKEVVSIAAEYLPG